ncbi:hypothetical protein AGMMS50276_25440 [Synergistales bacterium]|nr:hypothetical protein AGMMS50276_25440 [Synergistales bacterium]
MDFRISNTFSDSLARLTNEEQKQVKITTIDLQIAPDSPGLSFHKLNRAKDKNFWSVRVSGDIRIIVHRLDDSLLVCYVDHHDKAYDWAEHHKFSFHPVTGAAQIVEIRERIEEIVIPKYIEKEFPTESLLIEKNNSKLLFSNLSDETLLGYGVPEEWIDDVRRADEDNFLALIDHLPSEAMEALFAIASGDKPIIHKSAVGVSDDKNSAFEHPDAKRRFRVITSKEELELALSLPWEKWMVFCNYSGLDRLRGTPIKTD